MHASSALSFRTGSPALARSSRPSRRSLRLIGVVVTAVALIGTVASPAQALPVAVVDLYNPVIVRDLTLTMDPLAGWSPPYDWDVDPTDRPVGWENLSPEEKAELLDDLARAAAWDVIRFDTTNSILLPGTLVIDGGETMNITVRRKSSRALPSESDPRKVGLKVDLPSGNPYGVSKLSLENGGDISPVAEGLAWALHQQAVGDGLYPAGHDPAVAAWASVAVNGDNLGVFTSVEQRNKKFLGNRGWSVNDPTWLYEGDDVNAPVLEQGPSASDDGVEPQSPAFQELCFAPFMPANTTCPTPSDSILATQLPQLIDMAAMLTQSAVDAFTSNGDALMSKGKNYSFVDRVNEPRRYYPWDLDAVFSGSPSGDTTGSNIYAVGSSTTRRKTTYTQSSYQSIILNHPAFRAQYNDIMTRLLDGPLSESAVSAFLDSAASELVPALAADPYAAAVIGSDPAAHLESLKSWVVARVAAVRQQVAANQPLPRAVSRVVTELVVTAPASARVGSTMTTSAVLTSLGAPVANAEVTFTINKVVYRGITNSLGQVSVSVKAPTKAGSYSLAVNYAGSATLLPVSRTVTVSVTR